MNIEESSLVLFLLSKENFDKYFKFIFELNLELETKNFLKTIQEYFSEYPDKEVLSVEELLVFFSVKHPILKKRTSYSAYLERLGSTEIDNKVLEENLNHFLEKYFASEMVFKLTEVLDGDSYSVLDEVQEMLSEFNERKVKLNKDEDQLFVKSNLTELLQEEVHEAGLRWRLSCLNESIGELRGGSLGHVFARVDTGKTSFIVSEVSNFASQLKDDEVILWCNNEEKGKRVLFRIYQSVLKCNKTDLINYPTDAEEEFTKLGGHKIKIYDQAIITVEDIEQLMKTYNVRLLVIDQGDKVRFSGDRDMSTVDRLKAVYGKFRELAKSYDCDVIAVGQASASAEGLKWLKTSDMDNSKTGKPGELDYAIGIGKSFDDVDNPVCSIRYISLCKNKMNEGKHGRYEVVFNASCALYTDKASGSFSEVSKSDDQSPQGSGSPEIKSTFKSLLSEIYGNPNMEQK